MRIGIIGAGISGLATAFWIQRARPDWTLTVFESAPAPGGALHTEVVDGFRFEAGCNGFLTNKPDSLELVRASGATPLLLESSSAARTQLLGVRRRPQDEVTHIRGFGVQGGHVRVVPADLQQVGEQGLEPVKLALQHFSGPPGIGSQLLLGPEQHVRGDPDGGHHLFGDRQLPDQYHSGEHGGGLDGDQRRRVRTLTSAGFLPDAGPHPQQPAPHHPRRL